MKEQLNWWGVTAREKLAADAAHVNVALSVDARAAQQLPQFPPLAAAAAATTTTTTSAAEVTVEQRNVAV